MTLSRPAFDNSYARLPERFWSAQEPVPVAQPALIRINHGLASMLGISAEWWGSPEGLEVLAGNRVPEGSEPIAQAYAGHQFGGWNPQLGDGRAVLLGEIVTPQGQRYDIQLKGAGRTVWSRGGDGRSPLGPVLREYIVSEAMAALGVPTTRSLAAVATGESVLRERPLPGAILTRVASSHIRVGTFEYFAGKQDYDAQRLLADHVIARHYPEAARSEQPYLALLEGVIARQARLIAQWQQLGFIHGVMNTDNMLVSGETIDYGPCAFLDEYSPATVFSSIDSFGRYAYGNQPAIAQWNLAWLARVLLPIVPGEEDPAVHRAQQAIEGFIEQYEAAWRELMHHKLGIAQPDASSDTLLEALLELMTRERADFTLTFSYLTALAGGDTILQADIESFWTPPPSLANWLPGWQARLQQAGQDASARHQLMRRANPLYIPRNHLVEEAIAAATDHHDFSLFQQLVERVTAPFDFDPAARHYLQPPRPEQVVKQTFCGT